MDQLITAAELARRWAMNPRTLTNWRTQGRGPAYIKLGVGGSTRVLYRVADVLAWEANRMRQPGRGQA